MGRETPFSVAYAVCYLESPAAQTGVVLRIGSDDQAKIFLNESEVYRSTKTQSWEPERDTVSGIELKAGLNVLVFKVVNEREGWVGSVRISDAAGQVIKGLRVTLDPRNQELRLLSASDAWLWLFSLRHPPVESPISLPRPN